MKIKICRTSFVGFFVLFFYSYKAELITTLLSWCVSCLFMVIIALYTKQQQLDTDPSYWLEMFLVIAPLLTE